jgi:hypothetical protein
MMIISSSSNGVSTDADADVADDACVGEGGIYGWSDYHCCQQPE